MAFPEPLAIYPVLSMPVCDPSVPRNVCPPPGFRRPYTPPSPMQRNAFPPPPPNMPSPFHSMPPKSFPPPPPANIQRPLTPPPSAPSSPAPVLDLNRQNEILTQRWPWLPSMPCSLANDPSGDVYKIISINWDGASKEYYIKKLSVSGETVAGEGKDVQEDELILPAPPRQLAPPPFPPQPFPRQEMTPPPSDSGSGQGGAPIQVMNYGGPPPPMPGLGNGRPAYVEECDSNDEDDVEYRSKPPLSPDMAARGRFPSDEDGSWWTNQSQEFRNEHDDEFYDRGNEQYPGGEPEFIALGQPESSVAKSERRSHDGKKHRRRHSSKSDKEKERGGDKKSKSSSKSRSRRSSTSKSDVSKDDERREEKRDSSHRDRGRKQHQSRKPGLYAFLVGAT